MAGVALVVANGTLPRVSILRDEIARADFVLAADGGADKLHELGFLPNAVLGDFDSMTAALPESVKRISAPEQDATDLEKSIQYLISHGYIDINITGVTGGRLDHTFGALAILCKYSLRLVDNIGYAICVSGPSAVSLGTKPGQTISLMPCGTVTGVTTAGLQWPLEDEDFNFAERDGTSNVATGSTISVTIESGQLVVYLIDRT